MSSGNKLGNRLYILGIHLYIVFKTLLFVLSVPVLDVSINRHNLFYFLELPVLSSGG